MIQRLFLIGLLMLVTACQYFETEKVSSEEIYKEEIQTIDWSEVDDYPTFANCEDKIEKLAQQQCFIQTITSHIYEAVGKGNIVAVREIQDTLKLNFEVNNEGRLSILNIEIDSILQTEFPNLKRLIVNSVDSLQPVAPAYKRGIPVKTQFTLPIIIQTD